MGRDVVRPAVRMGGEEGNVLRVLGDVYCCVYGYGYEHVDERIGRRVSCDCWFVGRVRRVLMVLFLAEVADRTGHILSIW